MKPDVFIPGWIFLIWGLLLFPLKSKGSQKTKQKQTLTLTWNWLAVLWQNPCDSVPWNSESMAACRWFGAQVLWMPTVVFFNPFWFSSQFSDSQHPLPVGCFLEGMQSPTSSIKYLPGKETILNGKMFTDLPFYLVTSYILLYPFLIWKRKPPGQKSSWYQYSLQ